MKRHFAGVRGAAGAGAQGCGGGDGGDGDGSGTGGTGGVGVGDSDSGTGGDSGVGVGDSDSDSGDSDSGDSDSGDSDSGDSDSGDSDSGDSGSHTRRAPVRPRFIPKSNRQPKTAATATPGFASSIDWNATASSQQKTHQIDDTDGLDNAAEYAAWLERQKRRQERDHALIEQQEREYEERMDRFEAAARRARERARDTA